MFTHTSVAKEAEERLADVPEDKHFVTRDGVTLKNLHDLEEAAKHMSHATFSYHVNGEKNDFHAWAKETHQDHTLAYDLKTVKSPQELHQKVAARVSFLEKIRDKEIKFLTHHHIRLGAFDFVVGLCIGAIIGLILAQVLL